MVGVLPPLSVEYIDSLNIKSSAGVVREKNKSSVQGLKKQKM